MPTGIISGVMSNLEALEAQSVLKEVTGGELKIKMDGGAGGYYLFEVTQQPSWLDVVRGIEKTRAKNALPLIKAKAPFLETRELRVYTMPSKPNRIW